MSARKSYQLGNNPLGRGIALVVTVCLFSLFAYSLRGVTNEPPARPLVWQQTSQQNVFSVTLDSRATSVPLREFQEWTIEVRDANGDPVYPARFAIGGGMPGHGHGLPSQPRVTEHLSAGKYLISGLKFNMAGEWLLLFDIESETSTDRVSFEFQIEF